MVPEINGDLMQLAHCYFCRINTEYKHKKDGKGVSMQQIEHSLWLLTFKLDRGPDSHDL